MNYNEVINKSKTLLQRIEKMGVGMEGGGPVEHQTGAFGNVKPEETDEETEYTPKDISSEKPFRRRKGVKEQYEVEKNDVETNQSGFGYTDEEIAEDDFYTPDDIKSEDNCTYGGEFCEKKHKVGMTTKESFNTGEIAMNHLSGDK